MQAERMVYAERFVGYHKLVEEIADNVGECPRARSFYKIVYALFTSLDFLYYAV